MLSGRFVSTRRRWKNSSDRGSRLVWRLFLVKSIKAVGTYVQEVEAMVDRLTPERRVELRRVVACVNACEGIPTEALEANVVRELIYAATRYLAVTMRESDDDPNSWAEAEVAGDWLREVLAKVWGVRRDGGLDGSYRRGVAEAWTARTG